ncbi:serine/threonine-protein kinase Nek8-like isoform X2 [Branchiostoma floridae]|uniref:Serine/threonine-protein kinase Nek8 n=1 Tax=Branchiostoma floridae TaxID=7739 RepID=A0A9J7MBP0_BRAFL|nr:serine/threonine-protein kinase Nek8-like isoform X1 [Branchiostoma floridae]XP_035698279.1 serine/threonine-protein kinase Nek8-like isoform X2 [Branchiostoma floridae]
MEKYERIRVVGRGAYGTVYLCKRLDAQKEVIIKQIPIEQMTKDERQSALNEVRVLSMLHHPNIIEYYESFLEDKALMIVMEYAPGGTIFEYLQQRGNALLDEEEILQFFVQMLLSLQHVHAKQILHRDLKTQNILLNRKKNVVKIGDFGISKILSSKSKAYTVVGTPCYISPELCEGKPYNQKSDIWALGCVLYELASLKRAFEAANLPALVLKIMRGTFAPISDRYSEDLRRLILSMLHLDPSKRPTITQIMAQPIVITALIGLYTDLGGIQPSKPQHPLSSLPPVTRGRGSRVSSARSHRSAASVVLDSSGNLAQPRPLSSVFSWGGGITQPVKLQLPHSDTQVMQVSTGRTQKAGVTRNGRLIMWEVPTVATDAAMPGATDHAALQFIPRFLEGQSGVTIKQVSCGDLFTACLTDRGILMTFGSGTNGCLGHGQTNDVQQAKIVEALLGFEVTLVSCGATHVMAVTNEHEVFSWGRGDHGRLGLGNRESYSTPQPVPIPSPHLVKSVHCGVDCSILLTTDNRLLGCGSNRHNKLGLDILPADDSPSQQIDEMCVFVPASSAPLLTTRIAAVALGTSHSAAITESGQCYTFGANNFNQLGYQKDSKDRRPQLVPALEDVCISMVECGDTFTVAITTEGEVYTWGKGSRGRLGRREENTKIPKPVPLLDSEPFQIISISCSHGNTLLATEPIPEPGTAR